MTSEHPASEAKSSEVRRPAGWRTTIKGTAIPIKILFSDVGVANCAKRIYEISNSRLYWLTLIAPNAVSGDHPAKAKALIETTIQKTSAEMTDLIHQARTMMDSNEIALGEIAGTSTFEGDAKTPLSKRFIGVFQLVDSYMVVIDTLWINGVLTDEEREQSQKSARRKLHAIAGLIGESYKHLIKETEAAPNDTPQTKAEPAEGADADTELAQEA